MAEADVLGAERNFSSLSTRDLLSARDQYHWTLISKRNVVGTAIGRYRIRTEEPWPDAQRPDGDERKKGKDARTFQNSEVRNYSWPCVLVLVDKWIQPNQFGVGPGKTSPEELVPSTLYLPDGREVPVCVVLVKRAQADQTMLPPRSWPAAPLGGGFPLISTVQGEENLASVGTLVTDGHTVYALTSRHVAGPEGHPVSSLLHGRPVRVGASSGRELTRMPFEEVYDLPARRTYLTIDAGLIRIDQLSDWTSQAYGLPPVGELADLNEMNLGVRLVGAKVRAFGAASGALSGEVTALFYRYRAIGGYDQVTDFLIQPAQDSPSSRPGDSGTVWHLEGPKGALQPIALQWGGQSFVSTGNEHFNFALAASLTNVLRLLDVELVVKYNMGPQPYWGKTGHYTIGALACTAVRVKKLSKLMLENVVRVSFRLDSLGHTDIDKSTVAAKKADAFVPLADVPDLIWKNYPSQVKGGRDGKRGDHGSTGAEHPCHHANIDQPDPSGTSLRDYCAASPSRVDVEFWQQYYDSVGATASRDRGLLPFRVWQFFDAMVAAASAGDAARYVAAAGLLAHYVGDASQPLHGSVLHDGTAGHGKGVHSAYESVMVDRHDAEIVTALPGRISALPRLSRVRTGHGAAVATFKLMDRAASRIAPQALIDVYAATALKDDSSTVAVTDALWAAFGDLTITNMADSAATLAMIWESAWQVGKGDAHVSAAELVPIPESALLALYQDTAFVPSLDLDEIGAVLR